jgi:hypothetical protein
MIIERLSSLAVLHCYKHLEIDIEKVSDSIAVKKKTSFTVPICYSDGTDNSVFHFLIKL